MGKKSSQPISGRTKQNQNATTTKAVKAQRARLAPPARRLFPAPVNWTTEVAETPVLGARVAWDDTAAGLNTVALVAFWAKTCGAAT